MCALMSADWWSLSLIYCVPADIAQDAVDFHSRRKIGKGNKDKNPPFVKDEFPYLSQTPHIQLNFLNVTINN